MTDQFKWQKARIVVSDEVKFVLPHMIGKLVWVQCGPPVITDGYQDGIYYPPTRWFRVGLVGRDYRPTLIMAKYIELLPEFVQSVELIPYEVWSAKNWPGIAEC